jgi:hypothetical protein
VTGWKREGVVTAALHYLTKGVGDAKGARQIVDGLIDLGRRERASEVAKLRERVAELERQVATVRGAVAEAVMCDDVPCLVNSHLPKVERALGGLPLLPAEAGGPR